MKRVLLLLSSMLLAVAAVGCAITEEKKIHVVTVLEQETQKLTRVGIRGTLRDADGKPVSGVTVRAVTLHDNDAAITTREGHFTLFTRYSPGEEVEFQFTGPQVNYVESIGSMPTGIDPIKLHFTLLPDSSVHFAAYEY